jgi:hypothetical protein
MTLGAVVLTRLGILTDRRWARDLVAVVGVAVLGVLGVGLRSKSRVAAVAAVVVYAVERFVAPGGNPFVAVCFFLVFLHGARGAFWWRAHVVPESDDEHLPQDGSHVARHWRGHLRLPVAFWVDFVVVAAVAGIVTVFVDVTAARLLAKHTVAMSVVIVAMWLAVYALTTWQVVGMWRSAARRFHTGRPPGWARVAQVFCGLQAAAYLALLVTTVGPQLKMFGGLAVGIDDFAPGAVRMVGDGRELMVSGPIGFGLAERVRDELAKHPDTQVIRLDSIGGRVGEAQELRELIAERQLTTYTARGCFSACTLAFLGGRTRVLHEDADLGFHQYAAPGLRQWQMRPGYAKDIAMMTAAGVDEAFARRVFTAPHDDMWRPSHDELLAARYVTAISDGGEYSVVTDTVRTTRSLRMGGPCGTRLPRWRRPIPCGVTASCSDRTMTSAACRKS